MLASLFGSSPQPTPRATATAGTPKPKPVVLLVIQADNYDWPAIFEGKVLSDGRPIRVVQTGWQHIHVHADTYSSAGICVEVQKTTHPPRDGVVPAERLMTVHPDYVLVRNEVVTPSFDGRSRLSGLLFADVPSCNTLTSIHMFCDRAAVMGQLHKLHRKMGDAFSVVPQHFASSHRTLMYGYTFPAVVKVGSAHAGAGKMQIKDHHQMSDFRSVLAMMPHEHCFAEPFIEGSSDLRIQKIGNHYRAFRRVGIAGEWKTNTGSAIMELVTCTAKWRAWADAAAGLFGGLDILTVDAVVEEGTGEETIIEVNGTSSGLHPDYADEDNAAIATLVLTRMHEALVVD